MSAATSSKAVRKVSAETAAGSRSWESLRKAREIIGVCKRKSYELKEFGEA